MPRSTSSRRVAGSATGAIAGALVATLACSGAAPRSADAAADREVVPIDPRAAICPAPDAAPAPVTYDRIQQIFDDNCVGCHAFGAALDLSDGVSWGNLLNEPAPEPDTCGGILVAPGDPTGSYLYQKLSSASPCYGSQMPRGELFAMPLPPCVVAMVNRWIVAGAPGTDGGPGGVGDAGSD